MPEFLQHIDVYLFSLIHDGMSNRYFDQLMPFLRIPYVWAPVYLFLLVWMWSAYRMAGLMWCVFFFLTFVFCDSISAHFIKHLVQRLRPCNDPALSLMIHRIVPCGSGFSFPSAHASNHFGLAFFMIFTLGKKYPYLTPVVLCWALAVCFAQIYCGVHYPFDICAGAVLGLIIAKLLSMYFHRKVRLN